jgi:tetratricopeptide (TPR) repeat protein
MRAVMTALTRGLLAAAMVAVAGPAAPSPADSAQGWSQLRSANFFVIGDAGASQLRQVAERLEQFRETLGILFPNAIAGATTPTTVIVFKSQHTYDPYKPQYQGKAKSLTGYFLPGQAVNYITLTTEDGIEVLGQVVYHEFVHLLVNNSVRSIPLWFNEGLAEYYATFEVQSNGRVALLGKPQAEHVLLLRDKFLPIDSIVTVDHDSPLYNESDKMSIFYAESWALVHYLLMGDQGKYGKLATPFMTALANGEPFGQACERVLGVTEEGLQKALLAYVRQMRFYQMQVQLVQRVGLPDQVAPTPIPPALVHATLGDLLFHMNRLDVARLELEKALAADPDNGAAHASMGMMLAQDDKLGEARPHLERAVASPDATYLANYYYAMVLADARRAEPTSDDSAEYTGKIEAALRRAIALNPTFVEPYGMLAWYRGEHPDGVDEGLKLIGTALNMAPGREDFALNYAVLLWRKGNYEYARRVLEPLAARATKDDVKSGARGLLDQIKAYQAATHKSDAPAGAPAREPNGLRALQPGESRVFGTLTEIACGEKDTSLMLLVKGATTRVRVLGLSVLQFIAYRPDLRGEIGCGVRAPADPVLVTYRATENQATIGTAIAVEFVPLDYKP